jgi:hypothetical protein
MPTLPPTLTQVDDPSTLTKPAPNAAQGLILTSRGEAVAFLRQLSSLNPGWQQYNGGRDDDLSHQSL